MVVLITTPKEMAEVCERYRQNGQTIGIVPTMGALHKGHLSLVKASLEECDITVVSIFVNPAQFGPGEDLDEYPRTMKEDKKKLEELFVDIIFCPSERDLYPKNYNTYVIQEDLLKGLCAVTRPVHFRGVLTIVLKLFNIVTPQRAYFGQKDFQQSVVIGRMVNDFHLPIKVRVLPIVREESGLAMSSRNQYLSDGEREIALSLYESIQIAQELTEKGEKSAETIHQKVTNYLEKKDGFKIDYVEIVHPHDLKNSTKIDRGHVLALAGWVGKTRLIDNAILLE